MVLAAGESKRLDYYPKQLLKFKGKTLIRHAAQNAVQTEAVLICVVLGANAEQIKAEIEDLPVEIVVNESWADGMGSSLKTGLNKLLEINPRLEAVCVMLCDQPLVNCDRLIKAFQTNSLPIAASEYQNTLGVPAVFAASLFDELLQLKPDEGAKKVILKHLASVNRVTVPEAAYDIDTKEDFESLPENE